MSLNDKDHNLSFLYKNVLTLSLLCGIISGCSEAYDSQNKQTGEREEKTTSMNLTIGLQEEIDSAQLLLFQPLASRDSLFQKTIIYKTEAGKLNSYRLQLPAGTYSVWILGNVPSASMVTNSPYTSDDVFFDYNRGITPSAVYFGRGQLQIGVDTAVTLGMLLLSSAVELHMADIPQEIASVTVELWNTSSGLTLNNGYLKQTMNPPLTQTSNNIIADSTYRFHFYCFPVNGKNDSCWLEVNGIDILGKVIYNGKSSPFSPRPGTNNKLTCFFNTAKKQRHHLPAAILFSRKTILHLK